MRVTNSMLAGNSSSLLAASMYGKTSKASSKISQAKAAAIKKNGYNLPESFYQKSQSVTGAASKADTLSRTATKLLSNDKNNVFEAARKSGSVNDLVSSVKDMFSDYNATLKNLRNNPSTMNTYYRQSMENAVSDNRDALKDIGININYDRSVTIDENKLRSASIDDIEKALGQNSGMTKRLESLSTGASISLNNSASAYSAYGSYGGFGNYALGDYGGSFGSNNYLSALLGSRYNFFF